MSRSRILNFFKKKGYFNIIYLNSLKNEPAKAGSIFPQLCVLKENLPKIYESGLGGDLTVWSQAQSLSEWDLERLFSFSLINK